MSDEDIPENLIVEAMREHADKVMTMVPWARELGLQIIDVQASKAVGKVEWREDLVGNPETGVIHGGVITALLDNLCGVAVNTALTRPLSTATIDLRIDYMRPAEKGRSVFGEAECYKVTRSVAFTRAWAYHDTKDKVIATAAGTFALNDMSRWANGNPAIEAAVKKWKSTKS